MVRTLRIMCIKLSGTILGGGFFGIIRMGGDCVTGNITWSLIDENAHNTNTNSFRIQYKRILVVSDKDVL